MTLSDFAIVSLAEHPYLAGLYGAERVLVEAVETYGNAIFIGAARVWTQAADGYDVPPDAWLDVHDEHRAKFERLFIEERKQTQGPDYHDARHQPRPASEPLRPSAPVRYSPGRRTR